MRRIVSLSVLTTVLLIYCFVLYPRMWANREAVRIATPAGYTLPSKFSRVLALGHQGLLSDFLFLKTMTFIGERNSTGMLLTEEDWNYVIHSLDVVTDLDPYFADPYFLAEGLLAWDAGKPKIANELLKKGALHRDWDWQMPFFIGFNQFYFLKDYGTASQYIMQAADLTGSPGYLKTLGARLAYYGGKSETALLFLKQMIMDADNPTLKQRLSTRLLALERAVVIEKALEQYKQEHNGNLPNSLNDLVSFGYLLVLPEDPYGGRWGILKNGRVFSSSKFVEPKK